MHSGTQKFGSSALSEAVHAEVAGTGVTVTAVCPGPVPSEFQAAADADFWSADSRHSPEFPPSGPSPDAPKAAERGRATVVPGRPHIRTFLASSRSIRTPLALPVVARMDRR